MAYDAETLAPLRRRILERRHALVRSARRNQRELEGIMNAEKLPEMEEGAQVASAEYVMTQLGDAQRKEVAQIDAAIARMDAGTYGECIDCGSTISLERLNAMPYALRDAGCESLVEAEEMGGRPLPSL